MATRTATHTRRRLSRRLRHISRTVFGHWLLALVSHTLALVILLIVERFVHPSWCGG